MKIKSHFLSFSPTVLKLRKCLSELFLCLIFAFPSHSSAMGAALFAGPEISAAAVLANGATLLTSLKAFKAINFLKSMDIHDFLDDYIDELIEQNIKIMIFPTENGGALMSAESFRDMMIEELLKYEDFEE